MTSLSRTSGQGGTFIDRQILPTTEQGGVNASSDYDKDARTVIQSENAHMGASVYGGSEIANAWNINSGDILFSVPGKSRGTDTRLRVLGTVNGMGAAATAAFKGHPDQDEMTRQSIKNEIIPVGVAGEHLEASSDDVDRGPSVQLIGLRTLAVGNGNYGANKQDDSTIRPGELLQYEVPQPGPGGLVMGPGGRLKPRGHTPRKYVLQVRRASTLSSGENLRFHIQQILMDPVKWKRAMGQQLHGTATWATAAYNVMISYLAGVLFGVNVLMAAGLIIPSVTGLGLLPVAGDERTKINKMVTSSPLTEGDIPDAEQREVFAAGADAYSEHMAEFLKLVRTETRMDTINASVDKRKYVNNVKKDMLHTMFHDGKNRRYEFGTRKVGNQLTMTSRFPLTGEVNKRAAAGQILLLQLNHFPRGVGGFNTAIVKELQWNAGKAATGGSAQGSGNVHVALGIGKI